jgi:ribonuclease HI
MSEIPIHNHNPLEIYTDGAARGNPGPAAFAFLFVQQNKIIYKDSLFIGNTTNNSAEYIAIIEALKHAKKNYKGLIHIFSDSNLAIQQINNKWKVNYPHLLKLRTEVHHLSKKFEKVEFFHVRRDNYYIQICDKMCNERIDAEISS